MAGPQLRNRSSKKGAHGSLFSVFPVLVLLVSVVAITRSSSPQLLFLHCLLSLAMLLLSEVLSPCRIIASFLQMQLLTLVLSLFVLLTEGEGTVILDAGFVQLTKEGLARALLVYTQLHALFWLSRALLMLWDRKKIVAGLALLFFPLRFFRIDTMAGARLVERSFVLLPGFLHLVSRSLRSGLPGLARLVFESAGVKAGDVLIVHSNSGRNTVAIEMAEIARGKGVRVVALTSVAHSQSVESRHPKGYRLLDVADLVIDNCGIPGDAVVKLDQFDQRCGATSTVVGATLMNAAICEAVELLLQRGIVPPVTKSANLDNSDEHNQKIWDHYAGRLIYL